MDITIPLELLGVGALGYFLCGMVLFYCRTPIILKILLTLNKGKGAKVVYVFDGHKTIDTKVLVPDKDNQIKIWEMPCSVEKDTIYQDRVYDGQSVVISYGRQSTIDPADTKGQKVNPKNIAGAIYEAYILGGLNANKNYERIYQAVLIIGVILIINTIISYIGMDTASAAKNAIISVNEFLRAMPQLATPGL